MRGNPLLLQLLARPQEERRPADLRQAGSADFFTYLSRVFILEGHTINDLRVRLAGTVYRELYGFEVTGLRVGELIPFENRHDLLSGYDRCLRQQVPVYDVDRMTWRERGSDVCFERILLPFGEPQKTERILGFAQFFDSEGKRIFG
ncbi:MAG TPA: PAS domain-containing protein [Kiloniellaceae bacterium]